MIELLTRLAVGPVAIAAVQPIIAGDAERCMAAVNRLRKAGLATELHTGVYTLTAAGREWLEAERRKGVAS